ncbi:Type-2Aa cytolytic delta-endotoxin [Streptomyces sp. NPDC001941]|uniref:Type-2Aa cytolytic delta-endotoxin n=1 Tax=Streptomyces sp. NPDC001941 TaxID=3154659 RepID=UPI0033344BDC
MLDSSTFRTVAELHETAARPAEESPPALPGGADLVLAIRDRLGAAVAPAADAPFDFGAVRRALEDLPGVTTTKIIPGFGLQETAPVHVMVLTLMQAVRQALGQPFAHEVFWERTEAALTGVFVGLREQRDLPYVAFHEEGPDRTRYTYDLLFSLCDEETGGRPHVVAARVHVTLGLGPDLVYGLAAGDTVSCALRVDAVGLRG